MQVLIKHMNLGFAIEVRIGKKKKKKKKNIHDPLIAKIKLIDLSTVASTYPVRNLGSMLI